MLKAKYKEVVEEVGREKEQMRAGLLKELGLVKDSLERFESIKLPPKISRETVAVAHKILRYQKCSEYLRLFQMHNLYGELGEQQTEDLKKYLLEIQAATNFNVFADATGHEA